MYKTIFKYGLYFLLILLISGSFFYCNQAYAKSIQTLKNTAPIASFTVQKNRNVKLLVFSDYTGAELTKLKNSVTNMKSGLANDAKITVEYEQPEVVTLGTQQGSYKENTWGMLGHVSYTWSGGTNEGTYTHKPESASFSYSPSVVLPEGKLPASTYSVPTSCGYTVKRNDGMFGGGKDRIYSFYNSNGICAGTFSLWLDYSYISGSGGISGSRTIDTEPEFRYDDFWSVYSSKDVSVTNKVTGWDLSKIKYSITEGTDTYIIFAMNDDSTNYYNKSGTYSLGQLRSDANLGKYVSESNARVYSICSDALENVNLSVNPAYPVTFTAEKQNISLKELMSTSYDGRSLGKSNVSGLIKAIRENIKKPDGSVDMLIATDKSTEATNSFVSDLKASFNDEVSLKTSVVNNTEALFSWDKPMFSSGLKIMERFMGSEVNVYLLLSPSGELWGIQEGYTSSFKYFGLNNQSFTKIMDDVKDAYINRDRNYNSLYILKNNGTIWVYSPWDNLKQIEGFSNIKKMQIQLQSGSYGYKSILVMALDNNGYLWHLGSSNFEGDSDDNSRIPTKMHFTGNGSIVDFALPDSGHGGQGMDYTITIANTNNEVWEIHSGYAYDDNRNWVKVANVNKGPYNNQQLSVSQWQGAVHTDASSVPMAIDPDLRITDIIALNGMINTRYIGVDTKNQIYLIGGMTTYSFNKSCSAINTDMASVIEKLTVPVKAFPKDTILKTALREGSDRYFVYISDSAGADTSKGGCYPFSNLDTEIINYLKENNFNIYVVTPSAAYDLKLQYPYVPETRQTNSLRDLIKASTADGAFCKDTDDVMKIIENKYSAYVKQGSTTLTLIANEESIGYNLSYSDFENDPRYREKWQYTHLDSYFDNPNGLAEYSGKWLAAPVDSFDKVGKYTVVSQFRDNPKDNNKFDNCRLWSNTSPPITVIVHRRPYARFSTQIASKAGTAVKLSYMEQSYDPDHNVSREDKGITARSWQYKKASSTAWINGRPESLTYNSGIYQIKLNVKDMEGAWSKAYIDTLDTADLPPSIDANPPSFNGLDPLDITITASDHGENDFSYMRYAITRSTEAPTEAHWVQVTAGVKQKQIRIDREGTFYLHLEAYDIAGQLGKNLKGPYKIILNRPPQVTITGTTPVCIYEGDDVSVNFKATDPDMDTLICTISLKQGTSTIWSGTKTITPAGNIYPNISMLTKQNISAGKYVLEVTATDPEGMTGTDTYAFTVNELTISGKVEHTATWKANWQKYNSHMAKAGKPTYGNDTFFAGEKYILGTETTSIAAGSSVTPVKVSVKIVERTYSPVWLNRQDANTFNGQMWNQDMRGKRWRGTYATFLFTVTYSNGTVKTDSVRTYVVDDDYWRVRMAF